jgi:hypothetical protein
VFHRPGRRGGLAQRNAFVPRTKVDKPVSHAASRFSYKKVSLVVDLLAVNPANPKTSTIAAPNIEIMMNN